MFGIDSSEFLLVALVALVVIGPKDLPKAMRVVGYWVGKARGVARQFRSGFDEMVREAELADMEKRWAAENERIMREHPTPSADAIVADTHDASGGDPVSVSSDEGVIAHDQPIDGPAAVTVEKPVVEPATEGTGPVRGDGVTS